MADKQCDRCGVSARDTQEGFLAYFLAYNGSRLVCSDCDRDLTNEWCADTGSIHPLDTLNPAAAVYAQYRDKSGCQYCDGYCHGGCRS